MKRHEIERLIRFHMDAAKNPLFSTARMVHAISGHWLASGEPEYVRVYMALEAMLKDGELFAASTTNGGNVYMLIRRASPAIVDTSSKDTHGSRQLGEWSI